MLILKYLVSCHIVKFVFVIIVVTDGLQVLLGYA